jgi:hypothetical protein
MGGFQIRPRRFRTVGKSGSCLQRYRSTLRIVRRRDVGDRSTTPCPPVCSSLSVHAFPQHLFFRAVKKHIQRFMCAVCVVCVSVYVMRGCLFVCVCLHLGVVCGWVKHQAQAAAPWLPCGVCGPVRTDYGVFGASPAAIVAVASGATVCAAAPRRTVAAVVAADIVAVGPSLRSSTDNVVPGIGPVRVVQSSCSVTCRRRRCQKRQRGPRGCAYPRC